MLQNSKISKVVTLKRVYSQFYVTMLTTLLWSTHEPLIHKNKDDQATELQRLPPNNNISRQITLYYYIIFISSSSAESKNI